jgi:CDP-glycerol glycerophosphotransferase (TagB/SpsB family)
MMSRVKLYLAQSEYVKKKVARAHPKLPQVVIGTPKLDDISRQRFSLRKGAKGHEGKPVVCISFHWDGKRVAPEAGNALAHYREVLPILAAQDDFQIIGHGHPKFREVLAAEYEAAGIETIWDFCEVMRVADVYVNDCSSTMYEFCATGKPVVVMNAPWFRRDKGGDIRFWDYADVGPQVETAEELLPAIRSVLEKDLWMVQREKMLADLYPYRGYAAQRAAAAIEAFAGAMR